MTALDAAVGHRPVGKATPAVLVAVHQTSRGERLALVLDPGPGAHASGRSAA